MDRRTRRELLARLSDDASRIAAHFELRYRSLDAERSSVKSRYGICYDDGSIRIRLNHSRTGEPLRYSSLVNTLCHELAHLRHFDHGPRFKAFYLRLLEWSRQQGIYAPGANGPMRDKVPTLAGAPSGRETRVRTGPRQLDLFG
jgi:predicted metal-dependent hydrolase